VNKHAFGHEYYPQQSAELVGYLYGGLPPEHPFASVPTEPVDAGAPQIWMLGSSGDSSELAGQLGAGFKEPQALIAVAAICADSREEAEFIAASHVYWKVQAFRHGNRDPLHPPEKALDLRKKLSVSDQAYYEETLKTYLLGRLEDCLQEMESLAEDFGVEEVMVVNVTYGFDVRERTYRELGAQFSAVNG